MFCDIVQVKLGDETVTVKRLTVAELRESRKLFEGSGECADDEYVKLVAEHCTGADGKPIDAAALSLPQLRKIAKELVGLPDGSPISDFIGLLL